mgnify:CR=1 FL=1
MKKLSLYLIVLLAFISCEDNVKFNNPSVQGLKDNVFWRATDSEALLDENGGLTITGFGRKQKMILHTSSKNKGIYVLGNSTARYANFESDIDGTLLIYHTGKDIGGDGQIEITEFDSNKGTVSGTFRFNAINDENNPLGGEILNFNQGVFYKIPVIGLTD